MDPKNFTLNETEFGNFFKREYSKIVSILTKILGSHQLDVAENMAQETLVKAMQVWPLQGVPEKPGAWLITVAKNATFDYLKRARFVEYDSEALDRLSLEISDTEVSEKFFEAEIQDNLLRMIFICCHPDIPHEQSIALALKTLCGLSTGEIAQAFLAKEEAMAQRVVRGKKLIRDMQLSFVMPPPEEMASRLERVLEVLYLMFNEGYLTHSQENLIREELCLESLRLSEFLCQNIKTSKPHTLALTALFCFQSSRLKTRRNAEGDLLLLEDQDRKLWDINLIARGFYYLNLSSSGDELSSYHLQAGIAACHAASPSFEATDWKQIVFFYDELIIANSNPILQLNRGVAIGFRDGFKVGLHDLESKHLKTQLSQYYLYWGAIGEMYLREGSELKAKQNFERALQLSPPPIQKKFFLKRISSLK